MDYSHYDELAKVIEFRDGKPYWTENRSGKCRKGDLAGSYNRRGYRQVGINHDGKVKTAKAARLNFYMVHGYMPKCIDHIDHDRANDSIDNLRACNHSQNNRNKPKKAGTSSIYMGVCWSKKASKWVATICDGSGKKVYLGSYDNELDAAMAYDSAAIDNDLRFAVLNVGEWCDL